MNFTSITHTITIAIPIYMEIKRNKLTLNTNNSTVLHCYTVAIKQWQQDAGDHVSDMKMIPEKDRTLHMKTNVFTILHDKIGLIISME